MTVGAGYAAGLVVISALLLAEAAPARAAELAPTQQTGIGVWYAPGAPAIRDLWRPGDPGEPVLFADVELVLAGRR